MAVTVPINANVTPEGWKQVDKPPHDVRAGARRKDEVLGEAVVTSVQREKITAKEVFEGDMCGLDLKTTRKLQLEEGDTLEFFTREVVKRTLG